MLTERDIKAAIISAGLAFSDEDGSDASLRCVTITQVIDAIRPVLASEGLHILSRKEQITHENAMRGYYLARLELATKNGNFADEVKYTQLAQALPLVADE